MPKLTPEKLAEAIRDAGFTAARLSREIGRDKDYVRDYLIGRKRSLKAEDKALVKNALDDKKRSSPSAYQRRAA